MSSSPHQPVQTLPTLPAQPFRLDVPLHDLLRKPPDHPSVARAERETQPPLTLPSPTLPQHPAPIHELDAADIAAHDAVLRTGKRNKSHWIRYCRFQRIVRGAHSLAGDVREALAAANGRIGRTSRALPRVAPQCSPLLLAGVVPNAVSIVWQ
jgi:hypothetical protein